MVKIIKFFKRHMYFAGGLLYLTGVFIGFILVLVSIVKVINSSLPGGSEVSVPPIMFNIAGYQKIQHIVGVVLKEEPQAPLEAVPLMGQESAEGTATTTKESEITEASREGATSTEGWAEK